MVLPRLLEALDFAAQRHSAQRRKGPDAAPYVNHLIEVAMLCATVGGVEDVEVLIAAVLHDVLEDTPTSAAEVEERFGARVRELVESLSDDKSLPRPRRREITLEELPACYSFVEIEPYTTRPRARLRWWKANADHTGAIVSDCSAG